MKHAKIINGKVDNISLIPTKGYIECPDDIFAGATYDGTIFINAVKTANEILLKNKETFKLNRCNILNSISWIHERIQSQTVLIQGGEALTASYTVAQSTEYYRFKQALRDRPSIIADWSSISYPIVPQHVYDDMADNIKLLCQELLCNPVV